MDRKNKIERLKDELYAGDYKVVKNAELLAKGMSAEYDVDALHEERQAIRDEINLIQGMTDEEYYDAYPDEVEEIEEELGNIDEPYDIDV
jgi:hypothetical protein